MYVFVHGCVCVYVCGVDVDVDCKQMCAHKAPGTDHGNSVLQFRRGQGK